jgi:hypothetical protein
VLFLMNVFTLLSPSIQWPALCRLHDV